MRKIILSLVILSSLSACTAQSNKNTLTENAAQAEHALNQNPKDQHAWQQLYILINDNYTRFSTAERRRLRGLLEKYGSFSSGTLYTANEPGTKIIIKGHIITAKGKPIANAAVHIFQTDSRGYYTPLDSITKKMGEPDARLFCFLKTDASGHFEIKTVRPASYPLTYEGRTIPQHIHMNITAAGYTNRNLQMVFDDDPTMNDYWRRWAAENKYPILTLNYTTPEPSGALEIILTQ